MWIDDPWARVQLSDENSSVLRALANEWSEIVISLAALRTELDSGAWSSDAAKSAYERAVAIERVARELQTQMWNVAT